MEVMSTVQYNSSIIHRIKTHGTLILLVLLGKLIVILRYLVNNVKIKDTILLLFIMSWAGSIFLEPPASCLAITMQVDLYPSENNPVEANTWKKKNSRWRSILHEFVAVISIMQ